MPKSEREDRRRLGAAELHTRIANLAPQAVIVVTKAIFKYIRPAAKLAGLAELPLYALPFPAMGNQQRYVTTLTDILKQLPAHGDISTSSADWSSSGEIPACPNCGSAMVLRTARRGDKADQQFYGCVNYPKCRGIRET